MDDSILLNIHTQYSEDSEHDSDSEYNSSEEDDIGLLSSNIGVLYKNKVDPSERLLDFTKSQEYQDSRNKYFTPEITKHICLGVLEPMVTISGGGGSGAAAIATVSSGLITDLQLTAGGSGYATTPTVTISSPGGSGVTETATITMDDKSVDTITGDANGSGYSSGSIDLTTFGFSIDNDKWKSVFKRSPMLTGNTQSQSQKKYYHPSGVINCLYVRSLSKNIKSIYQGASPIITSKSESLDIDTEDDLKILKNYVKKI